MLVGNVRMNGWEMWCAALEIDWGGAKKNSVTFLRGNFRSQLRNMLLSEKTKTSSTGSEICSSTPPLLRIPPQKIIMAS